MPSRVPGTVLVVLVMSVVASGTARAQGFVSPLIGYDFGGDSGCPEITGCEDKKLNIGVSAGTLGAVLGAELEFAYANDFFGDIPWSGSGSSRRRSTSRPRACSTATTITSDGTSEAA
jgi:hypothetical protein